MVLTLYVDGIPHSIDSSDPELLGRWLLEIFGRYQPPTPATQYEVRAQPSWVPDAQSLNGRRPDWIADTRWSGRTESVTSPRDLVAVLAKQLDEHDAALAPHPAEAPSV